jgi:hypothetical protein
VSAESKVPLKSIKMQKKKSQSVSKGAPSGLVISLLVHVAAVMLAGLLVVFTVVNKEEVKFEPPEAFKRPAMKLKKPKIKVKRTSNPKPSSRIAAKVKTKQMPEVQLPSLGGFGDGLLDGIGAGGFDTIPDLSQISLFGSEQSIGNDFVVTFYDSKRDRSGRPLWSTDLDGFDWRSKVYNFFLRGCDFDVFRNWYRSPKKLYATSFVIPLTLSGLAPAAFGDKDAFGGLWVVHYKGQLVCPATHPDGITFRFWATGDEFFAVKVNGKFVVAFDWIRQLDGLMFPAHLWSSSSPDTGKYWLGCRYSVVGDWITLKPGESMPMELFTGGNGGVDHHILLVEEKGVEYETDAIYGPRLPAFKTSEFTHDQLDLIYKELAPEYGVCLTNGPVFCDYITSRGPESPETEPHEPVEPEATEDQTRIWTLADGRTLEAEFANVSGGNVVLKNAQDKTLKVPLRKLSDGDIEYVELARPPTIAINILKDLYTVTYSGGFYDHDFWYRHPEQHGNFGVQLKQTSTGGYNHELMVEMFIVGQQLEGNKYLLLDRQAFSFNPAEENRFYEFRSEHKVEMQNYPDWWGLWIHGEKYASYLVMVTDKRGRMIAVKSPNKWLIENVEQLQQLRVGNYFDESCRRTFPDRPPPAPITHNYN